MVSPSAKGIMCVKLLSAANDHRKTLPPWPRWAGMWHQLAWDPRQGEKALTGPCLERVHVQELVCRWFLGTGSQNKNGNVKSWVGGDILGPLKGLLTLQLAEVTQRLQTQETLGKVWQMVHLCQEINKGSFFLVWLLLWFGLVWFSLVWYDLVKSA